jgi:hypothetical protein
MKKKEMQHFDTTLLTSFRKHLMKETYYKILWWTEQISSISQKSKTGFIQNDEINYLALCAYKILNEYRIWKTLYSELITEPANAYREQTQGSQIQASQDPPLDTTTSTQSDQYQQSIQQHMSENVSEKPIVTTPTSIDSDTTYTKKRKLSISVLTNSKDYVGTGNSSNSLVSPTFQSSSSSSNDDNSLYSPSMVKELKTCDWCGTDKTPEWRRGPKGPKTLCNACGIKCSKRKNCMPEKMKSPNPETSAITTSLDSSNNIVSNDSSNLQHNIEESPHVTKDFSPPDNFLLHSSSSLPLGYGEKDDHEQYPASELVSNIPRADLDLLEQFNVDDIEQMLLKNHNLH